MKKLLKSLLALIFACSMVSCAVGPTVKLADGSLMTLGGSFATEASADARSLTTPQGMAMNWVRGNVNETGVLKAGIATIGVVAAANAATDAVVSNNAVKNVAAKEATKQAGIKATAATEQAAIKGAGIPAATTTPSGLITAPAAAP